MSITVDDGMPQVEGVSHRYVDAGGLRVHLAEAGPEDGDPILLLHGWPQHWYLWRHVGPALADAGLRVLMPDLRGLGWTEAPEDGYEKDNLARDQVALLDALGLETVKLMGHDWGGYVGFLMCLLHPERVERYLPLNIIHPWPSPNGSGVLNAWRAVYQLPMVLPVVGPRATRKRGFIKLMLNGAQRDVFSEEELEAFEAPYREPAGAIASSKYYRSFQLRDYPLVLRGHWRRYRLTVPTLMLYGEGDFAISKAMLDGYQPYADDMRVETIPGTGHFVVDAAPDAVAARALEFFG
jgi:pimeloyl-ACP methyl ester carboxylesterase